MGPDRYRIVLVDDDVDIRALARRHLERSGRFTVVAEAGTGEDGVDVAGEHKPDVALLDLNMPGTDGLAALPRIRAAAPDCTVVVLSGLQRPEAREDAMAAGASGFLPKQPAWKQLPVDLLSLLEQESQRPPQDSAVELPASLTSGREARRFLHQTLAGWGATDLLDDAQLLTSELVNNAVVHATSAVLVRLRFDDRCLRVEVTDTGEGALHRQPTSVEDTSGRGLYLVDALAASWGTSADPEGKVVWFELDGGGPAAEPSADAAADAADAADAPTNGQASLR